MNFLKKKWKKSPKRKKKTWESMKFSAVPTQGVPIAISMFGVAKNTMASRNLRQPPEFFRDWKKIYGS